MGGGGWGVGRSLSVCVTHQGQNQAEAGAWAAWPQEEERQPQTGLSEGRLAEPRRPGAVPTQWKTKSNLSGILPVATIYYPSVPTLGPAANKTLN